MRTADNCLSTRCGESPKLNQYGRQAMQHWQRTDPERYARIEDPQSFFSDLGNQAAAQIQELSDSFAGQDQPGETYLEKTGRLNMARLRAEEAVLTELVWIPGIEDPEQPASDWVTQTLRESHQALYEQDDDPPA